MDRFVIDVDDSVNAAYIAFSQESVARTIEVSETVLVDLNVCGDVVGIELLNYR